MSVYINGILTKYKVLHNGTIIMKKGFYNGVTQLWSAGSTVTYMVDTDLAYVEDVDSEASCLSPTTFTPTKDGWTFAGWREDDKANGTVLTSKVMGDTPVVLYAVFKKSVTLSYSGNGATSGSVASQTGNAYYNNGNLVGAPFTLAANGFTKTNYTFTGWTYNSTTYYPNQKVLLTANMTLSATWTVTYKAFNYTGGMQSFTVPATGTYKLTAWGAQGGNAYRTSWGTIRAGGAGGCSYGNILLGKDTVLYICVGGKGTDTTATVNTSRAGGYNGGGTGLDNTADGGWWYHGAGGGGCTHIGTFNKTLASHGSTTGLYIVAGGGGGGLGISGWGDDGSNVMDGTAGGTGGGTSGGTGAAAGGTQSSGYAFGSGKSWDYNNPAGGGGGLYGGHGGGGGSGYIGGVTGGVTTNGQRTGNGLAEITLVSVATNVVTYNIDTGNSVSELVDSGASCLSPTAFTPTKSGYTFVGWRQDTTASADVLSTLTMGSTPITLYAVFKKTVTLSYHGSGASGATAAQSGTSYYNCGNIAYAALTVPANGFTWSGYTFNCWKTSTGKSYNPGDTIEISTNTTLYAYWPGSSYTVYTATHSYGEWNATLNTNVSLNNTEFVTSIVNPVMCGTNTYNEEYSKTVTETIRINKGAASRAVIQYSTYCFNHYENDRYSQAWVTGTGVSQYHSNGVGNTLPDDVTVTLTGDALTVKIYSETNSNQTDNANTWMAIGIKSIVLYA